MKCDLCGRNHPCLPAGTVNPLDHMKDIEGGFASMYRILVQHRSELLSDSGPLAAFANDPVRVVLRPTHTYGQIFHESFHPALLRNAIDRESLIDPLCASRAAKQTLDAFLSFHRVSFDANFVVIALPH